jgi:hypothetical protein
MCEYCMWYLPTYLSTHSPTHQPTHYLPICNRVLLETVIGPGPTSPGPITSPVTIDVLWKSHFGCFYHVPVLNEAEHFDPYNKQCAQSRSFYRRLCCMLSIERSFN